MAKRDSKGRFIKRGGRRGFRGLGTIITMRRGMGALPGGAVGEAVLAPAIGGLMTALVTLAVRYFADPAASETQRMLVRWAWLVGHASGIVASLLLLLLGGTTAAVSSGIAATAVAAGFLGQDMILQRSAGSVAAALAPDTAAGTSGYRRGMRAIVPETRGMRGMVLEPVGPSGHRAGTLGRLGAAPYGTDVSLSGVAGINTRAFGTRPYSG